jgi:hypothetical protein
VASGQRAQPKAQLVPERPEPLRERQVLQRSERQPAAQQAQPLALREVSRPHLAQLQLAREELQAASAQPSRQLLSLVRPPWHPLPL